MIEAIESTVGFLFGLQVIICTVLSFMYLPARSVDDSSLTLALFLHYIAQIVQLDIMTKEMEASFGI